MKFKTPLALTILVSTALTAFAETEILAEYDTYLDIWGDGQTRRDNERVMAATNSFENPNATIGFRELSGVPMAGFDVSGLTSADLIGKKVYFQVALAGFNIDPGGDGVTIGTYNVLDQTDASAVLFGPRVDFNDLTVAVDWAGNDYLDGATFPGVAISRDDVELIETAELSTEFLAGSENAWNLYTDTLSFDVTAIVKGWVDGSVPGNSIALWIDPLLPLNQEMEQVNFTTAENPNRTGVAGESSPARLLIVEGPTVITANLDESMRIQKGSELDATDGNSFSYEALFQGGTDGGFQGLKSMRAMVEKTDGFPPANTPENAPIGWGGTPLFGLSAIFTPGAAGLINDAGSITLDFSVANVENGGAPGAIEIYLTRVGPLVGGNTGPNGGNWGGFNNYNGTGEDYEASASTLVASIDPSLVQSYSFDVTNLVQNTWGGMASDNEEIAFLFVMQADEVFVDSTGDIQGDYITHPDPGVATRTNIELGTATDQTTGPTLNIVAGTPASTWFGFAIGDADWVDTQGWLGWVNIQHDPWIWVEDLGDYVYIPVDAGWLFIPN